MPAQRGTPIILQWQTRENLPLGTVYRVTITDTEQGIPVTRTFDWKATSFPVPPWLWERRISPPASTSGLYKSFNWLLMAKAANG